MMTAISGWRGIGKTYHLAQEAYERYKEGYLIVTNFDFVYAHINYANRSPEDFYKLIREILLFKERGFEAYNIFPGFQHTGIFIAIDEGHLFFSSDMWKRYQTDETFQDVIRVLAQARKLDIEIWYTTQDPAKIDKNWRRYTEDWIRFTPLLSIRKKIHLPHDKLPIAKRELRYLVPLVWMEWHNLDHENPVFDYTTVTDDDGFKHWSTRSTLIKRRIRRSGWLDPFPYKLYDSNEILSVNIERQEIFDFKNLTSLFVIPHTYRYERFPSLKRLLRAVGLPVRQRDAALPTRYRLPHVNLGPIPTGTTKKISLAMREEVLPEKDLQKVKKDATLGRLPKGA